MPDGFTVDPREVRDHAGATEGFAGRADVATQAGAHLTSLNDAYGLLCQSFGEMLVEPQQRGTDALRGSADGLHQLSQQLTASAEAYEQVEEKIAAVLEALAKQLDLAARGIPTVGGR
ncbi:type VII secretion target [Actinokineospora guangxiensis]|uniref:Type VII secretion target n=1 Tax=Actinokineospora guangxiensis TaxID=1490288 RepID=A0ABW0EU57_9PSEU